MNSDDDDIGYRKPPKKSRFKKGQSGNPKGRPKRTENVGLSILAELKQTITIRENGEARVLSKRDALAKTIVAGALAKDAKMIQLLISLVPDQFRIPESAKPSSGSAPISVDEAAILERFVAGRLGGLPQGQDGAGSTTANPVTSDEGDKNV